jgi:hypothetical protein
MGDVQFVIDEFLDPTLKEMELQVARFQRSIGKDNNRHFRGLEQRSRLGNKEKYPSLKIFAMPYYKYLLYQNFNAFTK